jgi:hypothetical protein
MESLPLAEGLLEDDSVKLIRSVIGWYAEGYGERAFGLSKIAAVSALAAKLR